MVIEDAECITTVTTSSTTDTSIKSYNLFERDSLVRTKENGKVIITIPNDGENYWFVPFDTNGTAKSLIGGVTVYCSCTDACSGHTCDITSGNPQVCDGSRGFCRCCQMSIVTGGGKMHILGGGVIMKAQSLVYNKNRYFDFTSLKGTCYYPKPIEMQVEMKDTITIITLDSLTQKLASGTETVVIDIPLVGDSIVIPKDGKKYWIVPFDSNVPPKEVTGGGGWTLSCSCPGDCVQQNTQNSSGATVSTCHDISCTSCCNSTLTHQDTKMLGGKVIVSGKTLVVNGVYYK